jgi:hypothetical protein
MDLRANIPTLHLPLEVDVGYERRRLHYTS